MYLEKTVIEGYKNFAKPFDVYFKKGLNVLVGENGIGKSAIIDAIRLLLLEDEFGRSPISDTDFHRPFKKPKEIAKSIRIKGIFADLSKEETVAFLPWTDLKNSACLTLHIENKLNQKGYYKRILWGGASRASIFEWELFEMLNCIYLPPLRDAESKLREGKSSRLARLLKNLNKKAIKEAHDKDELHPLEEKVREFNTALVSAKDQSIAKANELIRERLVEALGTVFGQDTHIQFSEINFTRIVESLRLLFFPEAKTSVSRDMFRSLEENSLGYNNLLYLATVLAELTEDIGNKEYLKLLLIEEPEAHLHPQLQIRLLKYLEKTALEKNVQVIVTTHSPVLASAVSLDSLIHLSSSKEAEVRAVSVSKCGLSVESRSFIDRWLDVTKSTLLFAKGIILVEGIAESLLMSELACRVLAKYNTNKPEKEKLPYSLEDAGVAVINMYGIYFDHFMQLFCTVNNQKGENIPVRCAGLTDNDPESESKPTPSNLLAGNNRALKLTECINKSDWARLYPNKLKTFEYDLAMEAKNMAVMFSVAKSLLDTDGEIKQKMQEYEQADWTKKSEQEKAEAAYYLLNKIEKGNFSQALANKLTSKKEHDSTNLEQSTEVDFVIPQYIHKAIIWACGGKESDA